MKTGEFCQFEFGAKGRRYGPVSVSQISWSHAITRSLPIGTSGKLNFVILFDANLICNSETGRATRNSEGKNLTYPYDYFLAAILIGSVSGAARMLFTPIPNADGALPRMEHGIMHPTVSQSIPCVAQPIRKTAIVGNGAFKPCPLCSKCLHVPPDLVEE